MPTTRKPPSMPDQSAPIVGKDGRLTPEWWRFLKALREWAKEADALL